MDYNIDPSDMRTPVQSGTALLNDIATTHLDPGQAAIWWLGQSGYAIKTASLTFYVDLYLSEHLTRKYADTRKPHVRMTHAPLRGGDLQGVTWVFSSHKHSDHLDPGTLPTLFRNNPGARLVLPRVLVDHAVSLGLSPAQLVPTVGDETLQAGPMTVHTLPSAHPDLSPDPDNGYPYLGFVFDVDGLRLYHSGDTILYDGLAAQLGPLAPDVAFLPINGTDARRNALKVPPNMNAEDALTLAGQVGHPLVIPHHYEMFTFNTADVSVFTAAAEAQGVPYRVLQCGEKFIYTKR